MKNHHRALALLGLIFLACLVVSHVWRHV